MNPRKNLNQTRGRRVRRVRAKISGTSQKPRLAVFRSNRHIYAQLIDDEKNHTLASASSREFAKQKSKEKKTGQAGLVGGLIAKKAIAAGVKTAVLDRRAYKYHGRVKAVAEEAKKGGLKI
ncbi:MAG: 50S ribosomal protein L18 [Candidatus Liptonbacteria bacterium]|nr:50S ribosomal protein L18 [Candidatus Liptonbacteria bacterium]